MPEPQMPISEREAADIEAVRRKWRQWRSETLVSQQRLLEAWLVPEMARLFRAYDALTEEVALIAAELDRLRRIEDEQRGAFRAERREVDHG